MLPKHVKVIMLSATVPNTFDFADWVGRTRRQRVYVISTPRRPVPLAHYLYVPGNSSNNSDLWQVVDPSGRFLQKVCILESFIKNRYFGVLFAFAYYPLRFTFFNHYEKLAIFSCLSLSLSLSFSF